MTEDIIVYQFSRDKVERGDFSHFLSLYALDKLPTGRRLRLLMFECFGLPFDAPPPPMIAKS